MSTHRETGTESRARTHTQNPYLGARTHNPYLGHTHAHARTRKILTSGRARTHNPYLGHTHTHTHTRTHTYTYARNPYLGENMDAGQLPPTDTNMHNKSAEMLSIMDTR